MKAAFSSGNTQPANSQELLAACMKATEALGKDGMKGDKAMESFLKNCITTTIETSSVDDVSGDAHLAVVRGSRRVFFEMCCSIKFKILCSSIVAPPSPSGRKSSGLKDVLGSYESKGTLKLSDVSSADSNGMSWLADSKLSLETPVPPLFQSVVEESFKKYKESVAEKIQAFLDDCKALP